MDKQWIARMREDIQRFGCIFASDARRLLDLLEQEAPQRDWQQVSQEMMER